MVDLSPYSAQTDLAVEARQLALQQAPELAGIQVEEQQWHEIHVTRIRIEDNQAGRKMGKRPGYYVTLEVPALRRQDTGVKERVTEKFAWEFSQFMQKMGIRENDSVLVIGLGNWRVTPDALGPLVVERLLITRHLFQLVPEQVSEGYRSVSGIAPGVLGLTGIETSDIIQALVKQVKPDAVVAVDALASRSLSRVNTTIQMADTGIHPGSGVGNRRKPIDRQSIGVPVIALGVPTVVDAVTIVSDAMDLLLAHLGRELRRKQQPPRPSSALTPQGFSYPEDPPRYLPEDMPDSQARQVLMGLLGELEEEEKRQLIRDVLTPMGHNLVVTPKEVDTFVEDIADIVATGLNQALHGAVNPGNAGAYTH